MSARLATLNDPGTPDQICGSAQSDTLSESDFGAKCASNLEDTTPHIENSRKSTQCCHNFSFTTATWETSPLQMVWFLVETDTSSGVIHATMMTPGRWTCPERWPERPSGCVTWGMNERFCLHGDKAGVLQFLLDRVTKECRLEGQSLAILRQGVPTQSHQSNGAVEKAVSTLRGLARTDLAVLNTKIQSFGIATVPFVSGCGRASNPWRKTLPYFGTRVRKDLVVEKGTIPHVQVPLPMDPPAWQKPKWIFSQSRQSFASTGVCTSLA